MFSRKTEYLIAAIAVIAPTIAAGMWIAEYWTSKEWPGILRDLPYLHVFFVGVGFWLGVAVNDLTSPDSKIFAWLRSRTAFCTVKFRTKFDWNAGQSVLAVLKFKKKTAGVTVRVQRYGQNGWNGDQPHWLLLSEETLVERRAFGAGSSVEMVLSTRGLDPMEPVQFGSHEIPMNNLLLRPHQKLTVTVTSQHGEIKETRIVNYHAYPLSFVTTPDQMDVVIQDAAPVEQ